MDGKPVDDYDAEEVLDGVESLHRARVANECRLLELAVQFAVIHNGDSLLPDGRRLPGRQRPVRLGGDGTPTVAEFAPAELGARMQLGTFAAKMLVADALDVRFRLPRMWAQVQAGTARAPLVRAAAQATRHLTKTAAGEVDTALADLVDGRLPRARFDTVLNAQVVAADPETATAREHAAATRCFARASRSTEQGIKAFTLRAPAPVVIRFEATVAYLADALAALGDSDSEDTRRVKACLILANPTHAVQLLAAFAAHRTTTPPAPDDSGRGHTEPDEPEPDEPEPDEPDPDEPAPEDEDKPGPDDGPPGGEAARVASPAVCRPTPFRPADPIPPLSELATSGGYRYTPDTLLPTVTVYVHLSHEQLIRDAGGVARFEGGDPITIDFVRRHLAPYHRFTITGVLDLAHLAPVDGYEIPAAHRTAVKILSPADVFPFATTLTTDPDSPADVDHTLAYQPRDRGGPPGQSRIGNYSPLGRFHHRIKTFGPWTLRQPFPGLWIWRDPHGHYYLVDHTGTRKITGPPEPAGPEPAGPEPPDTGPADTGPPATRAHDPDLHLQLWDATLRPAADYTFQHAS